MLNKFIPRPLPIFSKSDFLIQVVDINSYDMNVVTKEWSIAEKISRLLWDSNLVCPDKNPMLLNRWAK